MSANSVAVQMAGEYVLATLRGIPLLEEGPHPVCLVEQPAAAEVH